MPASFWIVITFIQGAVVGSFLNVVIYRMPLGLSVARPSTSYCPRCNHYLGFWDNIPLLSFLFLQARCRYCRAPIPWRYFSVELVTAALWACLYVRLSGDTGISWVSYVAQALFASLLVALTFIDLDHFFVPDELNVGALVLAVGRDIVCLALAWQAGAWVWSQWAPQFLYFGWLPRALIGALAYGGVLFLVSFFAFVYYARENNETLAQVARRFFVYEEEEPETGSVHTAPSSGADEGEEDEGEPIRLRFSPGFLAVAAGLLLVPVVEAWAAFAVVVPLITFVLLTRRAGEGAAAAFARFFRAEEEQAAPIASPAEETTLDEETPGAENAPDAASTTQTLTAEADQFAREAETGKHGGMGLGDVKLALAIGALLGPGMALLSLLFATASGALIGLGLKLRYRRSSLRFGLPFVPFMALGAILVMLYGAAVVDWYLRFAGFTAPDSPLLGAEG